ncbi:bL21 family ribosomal protein [Sporobolomyces koalae]|uniref:bL21 family ribosomal protein n=1 Tax=Sporobolomyces koalae TaxID=500713 RepID=UPI0031821697
MSSLWTLGSKLCNSSSALGSRSFSSTRTRCASSDLPPPLPHHVSPSTVAPRQAEQSSSTVPDEATALKLLKSQPNHYVSALLMGRRYLLTRNDILTVPHLKQVQVGTEIALTRILEVGSRDYTLRASSLSPSGTDPESRTQSVKSQALSSFNSTATNTLRPATVRDVNVDGVAKDWQRHPDSLPYLSNQLVRANLTVVEHTKGEMFQVDKFKRRKGYRRSLRSKLGFTKLRMGEITLGPESE